MAPDTTAAIERELNVHIFSVSTQLVGVCLTVIGLFRVIVRLKNVDSIADNVLVADAMSFLLACPFAHASLRSRTVQRRRALEQVADVSFLASLLLMTAACGLIAWTLL
jgi:hypothetical protein